MAAVRAKAEEEISVHGNPWMKYVQRRAKGYRTKAESTMDGVLQSVLDRYQGETVQNLSRLRREAEGRYYRALAELGRLKASRRKDWP